MHVFMFVLGWLMLTAALLCLGWQIWCAGRWLYRWLHPWNEAVDAKAREYLVKPCKLWPPGLGLEAQRTVEAPGKRPTTARATRIARSDALEPEPMTAPILPFSPSARRTTWTRPAGQHSPFAVRQDVSPDGEKTPVSDAPETG